MLKNLRKKLIGDKAFYAMVLAIAVPIMVQNGITWGITVYNLITSVCVLMIEIAYLILLARTIQNVKHEEN